ncbi:MAG TPA: alpha/beta hydrolase-fold protein [Longimicrobium sp.]|nr:alpha/beta hydrolase-fold protein [Longimicrobium sp.]
MRDLRTAFPTLLAGACSVLAAAPAGAQLTLRLTGAQPDSAPIYVAGTFNRWHPGQPAYRLARQGSEHVITLPDSIRGPVAFKFTRGSYETVETDTAGRDVQDRTFEIPASGPAVYTGTVAGFRDPRKWPTPNSTATKSVSILSVDFAMPQLSRTRRIWIYLPPDYAASSKRYPVLYMHDGQNVFDTATSYAGEWGVDEALDSLHAAGDHGAIVVAVDNGQQQRMNEYSPWVHPQAGGGEGDGYVDFIARTLKPYVDANYRTRPDAMSTGIMGSSMGGLISLYAALRHPDVFGRVGVFSPSLWFSADVFTMARAARHRPGQRWYFASGGREGPENDRGVVVQGQRMMIDSLAAAGFRRGAELHDSAPEDGTHQEWFWRREFPAAYRWLFADPGAAAASPSNPRD